MLLKQWRSAPARSRHGRRSYVPAPCPGDVVFGRAGDHVRTGAHSVNLLAWLDFPSKCFPESDPRMAPGIVYEWARFGVDRRRVSTCHARSPLTHNSHVETPSFNDGCCPASSRWLTGVSADMRASEGLHSQASFSRHSVRTRATKRFHESGIVLAGRYGRGNWMASSGCVSVGHAVPLGASHRGWVFSNGGPFVLVAHRAVFAECEAVASMVHGFVSLPCHAAL